MSKATAMHAIMLAEARKVGLPKHYVRDLTVHDLINLCEMEDTGRSVFWWRLRDSGTQFSSHSEAYARLGWDDEQEHCYRGDLDSCTLTKLAYTPDKDKGLRESRGAASRF